MLKNLRIGTRPSQLAVKQVEEIAKYLPHMSFDIIPIKTEGDRDKVTPLDEVEKSNFFTYDIEKALFERKIDAALHSAKDIEDNVPKELMIAAMTRSISPFECLTSKGNIKLKDLPSDSIIGTSSQKRKGAIANFRKDLLVKDIRGNIDERLKQLDRGDYDAIIVAHAALLRLGYEKRIAEIIPDYIIEPHPLQGRLAVQVRRDREDIIEIFRRIDEA